MPLEDKWKSRKGRGCGNYKRV